MVLFEDAADLLGLLVAFLGVFLSHQLNNPALDGVATLLIGVILLIVAGLLLRENKSLLLGEPAEPEFLAQLTALARADAAVVSVAPPLSSYLSPHEMLVVLRVGFQPQLTAAELPQIVTRLRTSIQAQCPDVQQLFIETVEADALAGK